MVNKSVLQDLIEGYKKDGAEDTKEIAETLESQTKEAEARLELLIQQGNPLAILMKGFMEQGKQNDTSNETRLKPNEL
ncbi:hypothetical protein RAC89_23085 [Paenibacillus sp. GD4]|uniref:hypothetical protein n=1 Tax=Paenibacillus sp. GD4 TaxID=3068890 RepID=UPI0027965CE1|nr:hypothetical protein [Paenibacillus sp. GD4]MDQ1913285.1 hypothetical protein [Paenibacillus sp. GD4]